MDRQLTGTAVARNLRPAQPPLMQQLADEMPNSQHFVCSSSRIPSSLLLVHRPIDVSQRHIDAKPRVKFMTIRDSDNHLKPKTHKSLYVQKVLCNWCTGYTSFGSSFKIKQQIGESDWFIPLRLASIGLYVFLVINKLYIQNENDVYLQFCIRYFVTLGRHCI